LTAAQPSAVLTQPPAEDLLAQFLEKMPLGVAYCCLIQQDGSPHDFCFLYANTAFHDQVGLDSVVGKLGSEVAIGSPESAPTRLEVFTRVATTGVPGAFEIYVEALQHWFSVEVFCPQPQHFVALFNVVTKVKAAEAALRASEQQFRLLVDGAPEAIFIQTKNRFAYVNRAALRLFGAAGEEQLLGQLVFDRIHPDNRAEVARRIRQTNQGQRSTEPIDETYIRFDGASVAVSVSAVPMRYGHEDGALVFVRDITARKQHEEFLKEIAYHDPHTKLPNGLLLSDRLRHALAEHERAGKFLAVCHLDLDSFKQLSDTLGDHSSDRLLLAFAQRLRGVLAAGDTVARVGHDEFVLLLCGHAREEDCLEAIARVERAVAEPYLEGGADPVVVSASIGITIYPRDPSDAATLLRHAHHAMFSAKQAGKNRHYLFDASSEIRFAARKATLKIIDTALGNGEFVLHYQPKVDCRHGRVLGVEALIRWQHPVLGLQSPSTFLPLVEDNPLALAMGNWVIREALRQIGEWSRMGMDIAVSVNAFGRQLTEPGFVSQLRDFLAESPDVRSDRLQIEIVETADLKELDVVRRVIEDCAAFGVSFSLDDFGTGYSSLVYLRQLPVKEIKIDQAFVRDMLVDSDDRSIVDAVLGLGRAFRRRVVAEGVETSAHIAGLLELGCDVMQGYALARPMAGAQLVPWMRAFAPDPAWFVAPPGAQSQPIAGR